jgi:hypothetical protein
MIGEWIYSALQAESTITSIVGTRVFAEEFPDEAVMPLIVYEEQSMTTQPSYGGIISGYSFYVTFSCIARDYDSAVALAKALTDYLDGAEGVAASITCQQAYLEDGGGVETEYDIYEKPFYTVTRDFSIDLCQ